MRLRRSSSLLVVASALMAQVAGIDGMLAQFEAQGQPNADQLQRNLMQISGGLRGGMSTNPRLRDYLNRVQPVVGGNRGLGLAMSGVYRQMGGLEANPQLAWLNYRNAFLLLNQFPMDN